MHTCSRRTFVYRIRTKQEFSPLHHDTRLSPASFGYFRAVRHNGGNRELPKMDEWRVAELWLVKISHVVQNHKLPQNTARADRGKTSQVDDTSKENVYGSRIPKQSEEEKAAAKQ